MRISTLLGYYHGPGFVSMNAVYEISVLDSRVGPKSVAVIFPFRIISEAAQSLEVGCVTPLCMPRRAR